MPIIAEMHRIELRPYARYIVCILLVLPLISVLGAADQPDFDDYRRVGRVVQPFSRSNEKNPYGVTLQLRENSIRNLAGGVVYGTGTSCAVTEGTSSSTMVRAGTRSIQTWRANQCLTWPAAGPWQRYRLAKHEAKGFFWLYPTGEIQLTPQRLLAESTHEEHARACSSCVGCKRQKQDNGLGTRKRNNHHSSRRA
jgi:hypothetical protein